jgi:Uma2 family endonuclease
MTPPKTKTGRRNLRFTYRLEQWAEMDNRGIAFNPTSFELPNGAIRAPDASWVRLERWRLLTNEQQEDFAPICPDFVMELMSHSDRRPARFRMLQAKMEEYIVNGASLGWLIDPFKQRVYIYRSGQPVECLEHPAEVFGDPILPGFVFRPDEIWSE